MVRTACKWLGIFSIAAVVAAGGVYWWMARDRAPTHPALAAADLLPMIPFRDFWANRDSEWGYVISPGKTWISWRAVDVATQLINIRRRGDERVATIETTQGARYWWDDDDRHLHLLQPADGRMALWKIDVENPDEDWIDITPRGFRNWRVRYLLPDSDARMFIATRDRDARFHDLHSVEPDGHGKRLERRNPGHVIGWLIDDEGRIGARLANTGPGTFAIEFDDDGDDRAWHGAYPYTAQDTVRTLRLAPAGNGLALFSDVGRDKFALVRIDSRSGEEGIIVHDPKRSVSRWFVLGRSTTADLVELGGGYPRYVPTTERGERLMGALEDLEPPYRIGVLSSSRDGEVVTLATNEQADGWRYRLVDLATGEIEALGADEMTRHADRLPDTRFDVIEARDGLEIPVFLTLPKGVEPENLPLVALIHGGPAAHDEWGYDRTVTFLADRGYAVLRVNYRGSTGFGRRHLRAGDRAFGRAMQHDIVDAVQAMAERGVADPTRTAIMGYSWGGYLAMMVAARNPGRFAAAISTAGILDFEHHATHVPPSWALGRTRWTQITGDPERPADLAEMRAHSPLTLADRIKIPVLLAHGVNDREVDHSGTERFARRLEELGRAPEAYFFEKEGHAMSRWQTRTLLMRAIEKFLARHLGGRDGGFDYVELGARYL